MAAPISTLPIGATAASSLAKGGECSKADSRELEGDTRAHDNSASVPNLTRREIETSEHNSENPSELSKGSPVGAVMRADSVVDTWESPDGLNSEDLYTRGAPRLFQRECSNGDNGGLCLKLSYEYAERMKEKVEAGRHLRALADAVAQRAEDLSNEESRLKELEGKQQEKLVEMLAVVKQNGRKPTQDEMLEVRALSADIRTACQVQDDLKAQRDYLPGYLQNFRHIWLDLVRQTEAMEEDILTRSNLLPESEGKIQPPWKINPEKPNQPSLNPNHAQWPLSVPKTDRSCLKSAPAPTRNHRELTRARIEMKERSKRRAWQAAHEKHEDHRKEYRRMLEQYISQQVNRPVVDLQAEFSRHWLEGWRPLIRGLDEAEKAYVKVMEEARAADVTIYDPEDDDDPTIAYDIDLWDQVSIKQLDRGHIERWHAGVAVGVYGPEQPAGKDEAELERQAKAHGPGQFAADDLDVAAATAPKMPPGELSAIRVESTMAPPALCAPEETPTSIQKIEQILTDVQRTLSRASEPTSQQANGPGLVGQRAEGEAAMKDNQRETKGGSNITPNEILFGAGGQASLAEATRETSPLCSQTPKRSLESMVERNPASHTEDEKETPERTGLDLTPIHPEKSLGSRAQRSDIGTSVDRAFQTPAENKDQSIIASGHDAIERINNSANTTDVSAAHSQSDGVTTRLAEERTRGGLGSSMSNATRLIIEKADYGDKIERHHQPVLTDAIAGDPAKVAKPSSKRKRAAVEEAVVVEPREKKDNEETDWKWKMYLEEYMAKYNIEPPPISKKRNQDYLLSNRDILITDSERAYGRKRRRIDEWGNKVRGGDC
ncbi:uncharacterized protein J4E88_006944 [Alternaria novae-zelandiae]|uniref:uncharacterized protein n=1 Tax=Alternaria novae-zelandiae TaxID=430562 RepID=UPI0020C56712|nr:uncharacterized protein J4E88_006944 [Alternaria novae-zelandiae]KAI4608010.1 hypothetical protein J4E80_009407 [Alternaria sp. BMP 0032]KAI4677137.1 hypothetical protein J4E88_006944 [Alternaria novae-zelandiae]